MFQTFNLGLMQTFQFGFFLLYNFYLCVQIGTYCIRLSFLSLQLLLLLIKLQLPLLCFGFCRLQFRITCICLFFHICLQMQKLFFYFKQFILFNYFSFLCGFFYNRLCPCLQQGLSYYKNHCRTYQQTNESRNHQ